MCPPEKVLHAVERQGPYLLAVRAVGRVLDERIESRLRDRQVELVDGRQLVRLVERREVALLLAAD